MKEKTFYCKFAEQKIQILGPGISGKFIKCPGCHLNRNGSEEVTVSDGVVLTCGKEGQLVTEITALVVSNRSI